MRLGDLDALRRSFIDNDVDDFGLIDKAPTFDITKNQAYDQGFITAMKLYARPQGEWIDTGSGQECNKCHEIQYGYDSFRHFCPNCGASMVRGEKE